MDGEGLSYNCALCKFYAKGKHGLLAHVRTMQHLQMEQIHQLQKRADGNMGHTEIGDIFQVIANELGGCGRKSPSSIAADEDIGGRHNNKGMHICFIIRYGHKNQITCYCFSYQP